MIDQNTTLQPEDRVQLKPGRRIEGLPLLATGKVIRGFADLLAVAFDNDIDGIAHIEIRGEYVVNMVEKIGADSELDAMHAEYEALYDALREEISQWRHAVKRMVALSTHRAVQEIGKEIQARYPIRLVGDDDSKPPQSKPGTGLGTHG